MALTDAQRYRLYEIIPGALVWSTLLAAIILSFVKPLWVIGFIVVFDLYWLTRIGYFAVFLLIAWRAYRRTMKINWHAKLAETPGTEKLYHLVFLPTVKEEYDVLKNTLDALVASEYPKDRIMLVFAGEERAGQHFVSKSERLRSEYASVFKRIFITIHPKDLPDEIIGKASNLNWSARTIAPEVAALGIAPEHIIVSSFDCDTLVHPHYFAYLSCVYATTPNPTRSSYQPMVVYNNNIWDAPAALRIAAFGTTFWLMTELSRPEFMATFSSHAMPWQMLLDVGFWQKDIVSEDSRIFLQGLVHYNGDYRVTPLYLPVSMDTVGGDGYMQSLQNLYKQQRRWAWGVENFPYLAVALRNHPTFPKAKKWGMLIKVLEGMYSWATAPILMFVLGRLPLYLTSGSVREMAFVQNTPFTLQTLMTYAMVGTLLAVILATRMLPPRPLGKRRASWIIMLAQWVLSPITFILFGAIPAIDAQTRMMLGKRLGFNVSAKAKRSSENHVNAFKA